MACHSLSSHAHTHLPQVKRRSIVLGRCSGYPYGVVLPEQWGRSKFLLLVSSGHCYNSNGVSHFAFLFFLRFCRRRRSYSARGCSFLRSLIDLLLLRRISLSSRVDSQGWLPISRVRSCREAYLVNAIVLSLFNSDSVGRLRFTGTARGFFLAPIKEPRPSSLPSPSATHFLPHLRTQHSFISSTAGSV